jgi:hypothetical protein
MSLRMEIKLNGKEVLLRHSKRSLLAHGLQMVDSLSNQVKKLLRMEMLISFLMEHLLSITLIYQKKSRIRLLLTRLAISKNLPKLQCTIMEMEHQD